MPENKDASIQAGPAGDGAGDGAAADHVGRDRLTRSVTLADGTPIRLRPIVPADEPALTALYERLSPRSAYQRFFSVMRRLPPNWAHILANVDHDRRMALGAVSPSEELIGVARYAYDEQADEAEIAIVVEDRWQGRGVGTLLLGHLIRHARAKGIRRLRAYVLADNVRMLGLLRRLTTIQDRKLESGVVSLLLTPADDGGPAVDEPADLLAPPAGG